MISFKSTFREPSNLEALHKMIPRCGYTCVHIVVHMRERGAKGGREPKSKSNKARSNYL